MKSHRPTAPKSPDPLRAAFTADVVKCEKLLAQFDAVIAAHERDEQALAALQTECAALGSSVDPMDSGAVAVLTAKERQVGLLAVRVASVDTRLEPLDVELKAALHRAADSQRAFLQPVHTALVDQVAADLRKHFREAARARQVAAETDAVRALTHVLFAYWTQNAVYAPFDCARSVLPQLRAIADGSQPWLSGA